MKELSIVVVDDSPLIRDYLNTLFAKVEGCKIVGMAADGLEGLEVIRRQHPDVVVLDIAMPHRDGIEVLRDIREEDSNMVIIMFTADPSVVLEEICLKEGANYYLSKTEILDLVKICQELQGDDPPPERRHPHRGSDIFGGRRRSSQTKGVTQR